MRLPSPVLAAVVAGFLAWAGGGTAHAEAGFTIRNEAALARSTALPTLGEALVMAPGDPAFTVTFDWTNEYVNQASGGETLVLDGETDRLGFGLRYGLSPRLEIGIAVPLLVTGGGVLDSAIENWHDFWNLPNGGRKEAPRDRLLYRVQRDGRTLLNVDRSGTTLGDIELTAGWQLARPLALRGLLKLPTGDEDRLTGGNTGAALWLDWDPFQSFGGSARWFGFVSAGGSLNAQSGVLSEQQRQAVLLGGLGLGYRILRPLSAIVQFDTHSPLYSGTSLAALKRPGGQLGFGARWAFSTHTALDLGFQEDVITTSSPDFSIHLGLRLQ